MENEEFQEILKMLPIWDSSVWDSLQKKDYEIAEQNFELVLENIDLDNWPLVYWQGIFGGIPAVLGEITESDWQQKVRPIIVSALTKSASGKGLSITLQELGLLEQLEFLNLFVKNLPGTTSEEKLNWLKDKRPSVFMLALAAPAQELGINPIKYTNGFSLETLVKKFKMVPKNLKDSLFSYENAETIFRIGRNNHFSDEKISLLARLVGRVLMGFIHPEDFQKELENVLLIDNRISVPINKEIDSKIFSNFIRDIKDVYEPININDEINKGKNNSKEIVFKDLLPDKTEEIITTPVSSTNQPFILHEEKKQETAGEKKPVLKSFSIPLGFFKPKNPSASVLSAKPVKVGVEAPEKDEKKVINYSELRTSLSPFDTDQSFISIGNAPKEMSPVPIPTPTTPPVAPIPPPTPKINRVVETRSPDSDKPQSSFHYPASPQKTEDTNKAGILGTIKKPEPKIEGNTIDLR